MRDRAPRQSAKVVQHPHSKDNAELVRWIRTGEPAAMAALFDRFGATIYARVRRALGPGGDPEDVAQQVCLNIMSSIHLLKKPAALSDWVTSVTYRTILKEIRQRRRFRLFRPAALDPDQLPGGADEDTRLRLLRVFQVLERMHHEDRMVFTMRYVERFTLREIGVSLGYSRTTVKRRVNHARDVFSKKAMRDSALREFVRGLDND